MSKIRLRVFFFIIYNTGCVFFLTISIVLSSKSSFLQFFDSYLNCEKFTKQFFLIIDISVTQNWWYNIRSALVRAWREEEWYHLHQDVHSKSEIQQIEEAEMKRKHSHTSIFIFSQCKWRLPRQKPLFQIVEFFFWLYFGEVDAKNKITEETTNFHF